MNILADNPSNLGAVWWHNLPFRKRVAPSSVVLHEQSLAQIGTIHRTLQNLHVSSPRSSSLLNLRRSSNCGSGGSGSVPCGAACTTSAGNWSPPWMRRPFFSRRGRARGAVRVRLRVPVIWWDGGFTYVTQDTGHPGHRCRPLFPRSPSSWPRCAAVRSATCGATEAATRGTWWRTSECPAVGRCAAWRGAAASGHGAVWQRVIAGSR